MLDTGSGDIMIVSDQCSNTNPNSGCFGVRPEYIINVSYIITVLDVSLSEEIEPNHDPEK